MKLTQGVLAVAVVGLAGGVTYHVWRSGSIERRLDEQKDEIQRVRVEATGRLDDHETRLQVVEARTREQEAEMNALETRLATVLGEVEGLKTDRDEDRKRLDELRREMRLIESRLEVVARENQAYLKDIAELRSQQARRDDGFERRLRILEDKLGIEQPEP